MPPAGAHTPEVDGRERPAEGPGGLLVLARLLDGDKRVRGSV